jgi:hypothetical protein
MASKKQTKRRYHSPKAHAPPNDCYVWQLPDEVPGTLFEIFAAEDSRRQNLVLYELKKVDAFRRSFETLGAAVDPYDLILAVMSCISFHLRPLGRAADHRRGTKELSARARAAAVALDELSLLTRKSKRIGWSARLELSGLPDPTDPATIQNLHSLASELEGILANGAFKDPGGPAKMMAFKHLVENLARIFEQATRRRATVTRNSYRVNGYSGQFLEFVEVVRPVAAAIIATSGAGSLKQPATDLARGKYIEALLGSR